MAKTIYFYGLKNDPASDQIRDQLVASSLLVAGSDKDRLLNAPGPYNVRKHDTLYPGVPVAVIEVGGLTAPHAEFPHLPERPYDHSALLSAWTAAPANPTPSLSSLLVTKKWNGVAWVVEPKEFIEGETIRVEATIQLPDGSTYTGPGSNLKFRVPLFKGVQSAPAPDGTETVTATDEQVAILPLQFVNGVAVYDFVAAKPMWICAVPGKTSSWLKTMVARVIVTKPV